MTEFTGLLEEHPDDIAKRQAEEISLPVCAGNTVKEKLWDSPPPWNKIESQKSTNMCAVNAGTSCAEVIQYQATGKMVQRSRNYLYLKSARFCRIYSDSGRTLGSVIQSLKTDGCCPEDMYPFNGFYDQRMPDGCDEEAAKFKLLTTIDVRTGGYSSARTLIGQNLGTILMASYWTIEYQNGYQVVRYRPLGSAGHARAFLFLSSRLDSQGRPFIWCANSHGNQAQHNGYEEWSPDAVDQLLDRDPWGITGLSDMTNPQPREVSWVENNPFEK